MQVADQKLKWHIAGLVALMVLLGLGHEWVNPWLRYDREAVEAGQVWRLVTCHLVHLNVWHMAMNLTGFLLCSYFFNDLLTRKLVWVWLSVSTLTVGLAFYFIDTGLQWYVGLSGILHGLLIICLLTGWRGNPVLHSVVLVAVVGRLIWEHTPDYDVNYLQGVIHGRVYVNAHMYGSLTGAVIGALACLRQTRTEKLPDASA